MPTEHSITTVPSALAKHASHQASTYDEGAGTLEPGGGAGTGSFETGGGLVLHVTGAPAVRSEKKGLANPPRDASLGERA